LISHTTHGSNFRGLLNYLLDPSKRPTIVAPYMLSDNARDLAREFETISNLRPTTRLPVRHISLSFAPEDGEVSDIDKEAIVIRVVAEMNYQDCQFIGIAHHRDDPGHDLPHDHDHLHLVVNAINVYGERISDSFDGYRIQAVLRGIERDFGLRQVKSSWAVKAARADRINSHLEISALVDRSLTACPNLATWLDRLQQSQIDVRFALRKDRQVKGITYLHSGRAYKGSEVGASWGIVEARISIDPTDISLILATNAHSQYHPIKLWTIDRQNFDCAVVMAITALQGRAQLKTGRLDIRRDDRTLTVDRIRPHRQMLNAIETDRGWEPVGYSQIDRQDLHLLVKISGCNYESANILVPQDRSTEISTLANIGVSLQQLIDLKNYYLHSPAGRAKPASIDAVEKFGLYKLQLSQAAKAVTQDRDLKLTNQFFDGFKSEAVTLSAEDRSNLAAADKFAIEQVQFDLQVRQQAVIQPNRHNTEDLSDIMR
jgi:Relaxase/Mobilisation nuclease domain